jgi:hypothetical protein
MIRICRVQGKLINMLYAIGRRRYGRGARRKEEVNLKKICLGTQMLVYNGNYDAAATLWRVGRRLLAELLRRDNRVIIARKNLG